LKMLIRTFRGWLSCPHFLLIMFTINISAEVNHNKEGVILLHGLTRTSKVMSKMQKALVKEGYLVLNQTYPSREKEIEELTEETIPLLVDSLLSSGVEKIHFVTHSMGGIMVRYYLTKHELPELGRIVMLSPPNQGSEVVDKLDSFFMFKWLNGPAGQQLGTTEDDLPARLAATENARQNYELGIITGDRSVNLILSLLIPGKDDGKVAVKRAQLRTMKDFRIIHATHPFIARNKKTIELVTRFLEKGEF